MYKICLKKKRKLFQKMPCTHIYTQTHAYTHKKNKSKKETKRKFTAYTDRNCINFLFY